MYQSSYVTDKVHKRTHLRRAARRPGVRPPMRDDSPMATTAAPVPATPGEANRVASFPRLRYMGSKYRLVPHLAAVFSEIGGQTALDAFSGSGVVSYLLKTLGYQVTASDFLNFPSAIARATVVNQHDKLDTGDVEAICGAPADERDFIQQTFRGMYFTEDDLRFLDSAWSHIDQMRGHKRDLAISSLVLSAARRQPRGVFTFTDLRYNDGRRDLRLSLEGALPRAGAGLQQGRLR